MGEITQVRTSIMLFMVWSIVHMNGFSKFSNIIIISQGLTHSEVDPTILQSSTITECVILNM